jgi:hypothetical protein
MDPRERLTAGQVAAREGRHEDALREYVWFHDHALEHRESLYGVRLSFALSYWMELAEAYPPARQKLEEIRNNKAAALLTGKGNRELFNDVASINESLGDERKTYELFRQMIDRVPLLAPVCAGLALEAIVKAGDFMLAAQYADPPEEALLRNSARLNADVADLQGDKHREHTLDAYVYIYCERVRLIVETLRGLGQRDDAAAATDWALALVESKRLRARVAKQLTEVI